MKVYFKKFFSHRRLINKIFDQALAATDNDVHDVAVGVCQVSSEEIRRLNSTHRNVDKVTDVLSFPFLQTDYKTNKLADFDNERSPDGTLYLGDIYICTAVAKAQAKQYGHSFKRELCFLALHGLLHLLGYDHMTAQDEKVMQSTAEQILQNFGINRGEKC